MTLPLSFRFTGGGFFQVLSLDKALSFGVTHNGLGKHGNGDGVGIQQPETVEDTGGAHKSADGSEVLRMLEDSEYDFWGKAGEGRKAHISSSPFGSGVRTSMGIRLILLGPVLF